MVSMALGAHGDALISPAVEDVSAGLHHPVKMAARSNEHRNLSFLRTIDHANKYPNEDLMLKADIFREGLQSSASGTLSPDWVSSRSTNFESPESIVVRSPVFVLL
jgi:hypothetical protein